MFKRLLGLGKAAPKLIVDPKLLPFLEATVVKFNCEGCMASDHQFQWIGRIYDFERNVQIYGSRQLLTYGLVQIDKHNDRHGDIRDGFCGHERVILEDSSLQMIRSGLYFLYK